MALLLLLGSNTLRYTPAGGQIILGAGQRSSYSYLFVADIAGEASLPSLAVNRTKIFVIIDAHANLPALAAALDVMRSEGDDTIFHTGDAIAIGPQPAECVDLLPNAIAYDVAGRLDLNFLPSFLQTVPITFRADLAAGEMPPPGSTHCPIM